MSPSLALGGTSTLGVAVAHLDLPPGATARFVHNPRERRMRQIERAMALADGASLRLPDGTMAYAGHRLVRDGARVALITIARLLRFDVRPQADSFSFTVRNLTGLPAACAARELPVRPHHRAEGPPLNEYELQLQTPDGHEVCIVVRMPPYLGALANEYSAIALVS